MSFTHLHVHSHYSLLDALTQVGDLVSAAKKRGFTSIALTDHANLYGAIEFYEACLKEGIKPIIGAEIHVTPHSIDDKTQEQKYYHLVLLAQNYEGYKNLIKIISIGALRQDVTKPLISKDDLRPLASGLIVLSGCIEGEVPTLLKNDQYEKAKKAALEYQEMFGKENFYLELNDLSELSGQIEVNTQLVQLGKDTGIPLVVTRDSHYLDYDDAEAQDVLTCIGQGRTIDEPNRPSSANIDFSLATEKEIANRFRHVPEAIENTGKIADRIDLKLELNKWHFPQIDLPAGKNASEHLKDEVYRRLAFLTTIDEKVIERIEYELGIICTKGYSPYFLVVSDYVDYARNNGIIETTRGSGAGSIVAYAMGITTVNPLPFKLPFERFLNPFRPSPPDIDTDFADDRRDDMIAYVTKKYGAEKVAQIITFGTMAARGSIRDVGRALGYSYSLCDQVSKLIPFGAQGFNMTIEKALGLEPDLKELYTKNPQIKRLIDLAQKIEGCGRHTSIHAAGVVISPTELTDFTPIQHEVGGNRKVTQFEMHAVEAAGLLKMDFLGIRNLSILGHAVVLTEQTTGKKIDIYNLQPWDDKKTYEMLARGETMGVFQLGGSGMTRYLKELKPVSIFDIMAMVALFRPGPMESIPEYIKRKNNPALVEYLDPRMKDFLDQSLGIIVYQDDVLLTAINLAGYNWEEADKFRKAMGKKIPEEMMKQKEKFYKGAKEIGKLTDSTINKLWEYIEPFAAYGFNKAHAASYAVVAYQTAYMKANFPIQYMTAVLIAESGDIEKVPAIIHECNRMGIKVLPPDINASEKTFAMITPKDGGEPHIRFGLSGIKNLGEHIAEVIYNERKASGSFLDLEDLLSRVKDKDLNKKSLEALIKCGAMDLFGQDRGLLVCNVENMQNFLRDRHEKSSTKQNSLFSGSTIDMSSKIKLQPAPPATADEKLTWEKELLGLYVTSHPFTFYAKAMGRVLTPVNELGGHGKKQWIVVGGVIDTTKKKITRSGSAMMFVTIQDETGSLELLVFPKTYETTKDVWVVGRTVCVVGRTGDEEGDDKLFVEKAYEMTKQNVKQLAQQFGGMSSTPSRQQAPAPDEFVQTPTEPCFEIALSVAAMKAKAEDLKVLFAKYPGDKPVYLLVSGKKIKTSVKVDGCDSLREAVETLLAA